jgi:uncharacterized protein YgiB involved in biofilm formation
MQTARRSILTIGTLMICISADQPAQANSKDTFRLRFSTELQCIRAMEKEGKYCLRWFSDADRRASREAPLLASRTACEERFGQCRARIGGEVAFKGAISFQPAFSGIEVTLRGQRVTSVEPLVGIISASSITIARRGRTASQNAATS